MGNITREDRIVIKALRVATQQPDLNPVDYAIWGALQERVYHGRKFENVEQLKQAILLELRALSQRLRY